MIVISLLALVASVSAACSDNMKCAACAAATGCGWCDYGAAGSCMDSSTLDLACTAPTGSKTANGGTCPDKCANNTITAGNCKVASGWKTQTPLTCNAYNMPPTAAPTTAGTTGTTAAPDKCAMAYAADGAACAQALADFGCSYGCQKCTDGGLGGKLCKSVCDGFKAKCPTVVKDCTTLPFGDYACAAGETDCAMDMIEGTPAAGASTTAPTTAPTGATPATNATVPIVAGDCKQTTCTACATAKCIWCATGMTSETQANGNCVAANATCTSLQTAYNETSKCVKDANDACEAHTACAACAADTKCSWCDTGAATGIASTGSCNSGTTCKNSLIKPTPATECSATTTTVAIVAVLGALLAAF